MANEERVLVRSRARELTEQEAMAVNGAIRTATLCTAPSKKYPQGDGDASIGEC